MTTRLTRTLVAIGILASVVTACTGHDEPDNPAAPASLSDPCLLITDELLERLIPGGIRAPTEHLGTISGHKQCDVDMATPSGTVPVRASLAIQVAIDGVDPYDEAWRSKFRDAIEAEPTPDGPGDVACWRAAGRDGGETRIDGWAWVGDDYQAWVLYRLFEPQKLPTDAERLIRALLAAAANSLPSCHVVPGAGPTGPARAGRQGHAERHRRLCGDEDPQGRFHPAGITHASGPRRVAGRPLVAGYVDLFCR